MYFGVSPLLLLENLLLPCGYTQAILLKDKTLGGQRVQSFQPSQTCDHSAQAKITQTERAAH